MVDPYLTAVNAHPRRDRLFGGPHPLLEPPGFYLGFGSAGPRPKGYSGGGGCQPAYAPIRHALRATNPSDPATAKLSTHLASVAAAILGVLGLPGVGQTHYRLAGEAVRQAAPDPGRLGLFSSSRRWERALKYSLRRRHRGPRRSRSIPSLPVTCARTPGTRRSAVRPRDVPTATGTSPRSCPSVSTCGCTSCSDSSRPGWGYVHFAESVNGRYENPLSLRALTPVPPS